MNRIDIPGSENVNSALREELPLGGINIQMILSDGAHFMLCDSVIGIQRAQDHP
jgi:hypothetical protein